eukprot:COSAG05_NODE_3571_length_1985_cov_4.120891_2_plen_256_part_00
MTSLMQRDAETGTVSRREGEAAAPGGLKQRFQGVVRREIAVTRAMYRTSEHTSRVPSHCSLGPADPVDATDSYGMTRLMWASGTGRESEVGDLLARRAQTDLQNETRWTALHFAANQGQLGIVRQLLGARADASLKNALGDTPLDMAQKSGKVGVEKLLREYLSGRKVFVVPRPPPPETAADEKTDDTLVDLPQSSFTGVSWCVESSKWKAAHTVDGTSTVIGFFGEEQAAARAYDEHALQSGLDLNFPQDNQGS